MQTKTEFPIALKNQLVIEAKRVFPYAQFKVKIQGEEGISSIDFEAYLAIEQRSDEEIQLEPFDPYFRREHWDFDTAVGYETLIYIAGLWRGRYLLYKLYDDGTGQWLDEDEEISRPYPHGDKFEELAQRIDEIIKAYYSLNSRPN